MNLRPIDRRDAYRADITYGTNNEFGFDYLRDNMKFSLDEYVQRELNYAIVDEVDNILIDEARTPLIISGAAEESTDKYYTVDRIIPRLRKEVDYTIDEKHRSAMLTEEGVAKCERLLGIANLYDPSQIDMLHHVTQALKGHTLFKRDVDYVVKDGEVIIVDEFTGRLMPGRRWSDGLHQAVEAKEGVRIERENQTLATVTIQNYFRMYAKLAGMTGTADTEAVEFKKIYKLDVVVMPPNKPMRRVDEPDVVYKSEREKFDAVVEEIQACHEKGQPVLVGTTSVEKSERVSKLLKKAGVRHNVLNAINHEAEANIIAQAGRHRQVTIATNMAGRGTDILLGGNPEFLARAEMENDWLGRAGKGGAAGGGDKKARRYEDTLRDLRETYDEEVQRAGERFQKELAALEERRSEALRDLTDVHRRLLELSPYKDLRARFEHVSSVDLIPAVRDQGEIPDRYRAAKEELESAMLEFGGASAADERAALEASRDRYHAVLEGWEAKEARTPDTAHALDERRAEYERALAVLELALVVKAGAGGDGELSELRGAYRNAEERYVEAERLCEEQRVPYEEAVRAAERRYEEERAKYVAVVEDIREQLQKAPEEYESRYVEILEKYKATCASERAKVVEAGGLHILGTERHEARRIDNQLRGRGGRQGDPGSSRFFLSLEDDLLRIFAGDRLQAIMQRLGMQEGEAIEHRMITRAIRNAQEKVEAHNFDMRKHLLEYDDVLNKQREVIYKRRRGILGNDDLREEVLELVMGIAEDVAATYADDQRPSEDWDWQALDDAVFQQFNFRLNLPEEERVNLRAEALGEIIAERAREAYEARERQFGAPIVRHLEKLVMLQSLDTLWKDHLLSMDHLKEGIGLRGYGQVNPLQAYQREGYELFEAMIGRLEADVVEKIMSVQVRMEAAAGAEPLRAASGGHGGGAAPAQAALPAELEAMERRQRHGRRVTLSHGGAAAPEKAETIRREGDKVGRNDACPCGSGKKYKKCHGRA
jgi:preprotein translocase SecA subunit